MKLPLIGGPLCGMSVELDDPVTGFVLQWSVIGEERDPQEGSYQFEHGAFHWVPPQQPETD